jgi:hypothetical protein
MASLKRCPDTKLRALSFLQLLRCCVVVSRIATRLFPVISAGMAGPSLFVERDRNTGVGSHVGDGLVQFFKADVERLAAGAFRLLKVSDAVNIESLGCGLVQNFCRRFRIFGANFQFDSAEEIGDEPIHADHVVVYEIRLYPGRLQAALGQQRFGQIAKLPQCYGLILFVSIVAVWLSDRQLETTPGSFFFENFVCDGAEFVATLSNFAEFLVAHCGVHAG